MLALFPGLGTWHDGDCVTRWSQTNDRAPIVTYLSLDVGRLPGDACDQEQFGLLGVTLRQSEGVTAGALVERFTTQFGPPEISRDVQLNGSIHYLWLVLDGISIHLEEPIRQGGADTFYVLFVRNVGSPTFLPTTEEGERWMDRTIALITGPELPAARGPAAVRLTGLDLQAQSRDAAGCPERFMSSLLVHQPIARDQTLYMDRKEGESCDAASFGAFSMQVWQHAPVTAEALVSRISAKLGNPTVTRMFDRQEISYRWNTPYGTNVEMAERLVENLRYYLRLQVTES